MGCNWMNGFKPLFTPVAKPMPSVPAALCSSHQRTPQSLVYLLEICYTLGQLSFCLQCLVESLY